MVSSRTFMDNPAFKLLSPVHGALLQGRFGGHASTRAEASGRAIMADGPARYPRAASTSTPPARLATPRVETGSAAGETFFVSQLRVIEAVVAHVSRRHHLTATETQEFGSEVTLRLIQRDYEVLRRFQGRSSLRTYLTVVVNRLFLDYRIRLWGKWRPSAEAKRLGPVAMSLERLITRDGWSFEQAVEVLRTSHSVEESRDDLYAIYVRLSPSVPNRHFVTEDSAQDVPSPESAPDEILIRAEREFAGNRVRLALDRARQRLTSEERVILNMRFDDGFPVSEIAAALRLDQKRLYRRIDGILQRLRAGLVADGISPEDVTALFTDLGETRG
jgi:RNA polymerase sigma factor (sigma-70 family)